MTGKGSGRQAAEADRFIQRMEPVHGSEYGAEWQGVMKERCCEEACPGLFISRLKNLLRFFIRIEFPIHRMYNIVFMYK